MTRETLSCRLISRCLTHTGQVRRRNEDAVLALPEAGLWAVADGMGGHQDGHLASQAVIAALRQAAISGGGRALLASLPDVLQEANEGLLAAAGRKGGETVIGSTIALLLLEEDRFHCLWAGDSRIYLRRGPRLSRLTQDHVVREDQRVRLTRAVGADPDLALDYLYGDLYEGDRFLLCSDGLSGVLSDAEMSMALDSYGGEGACAALVDAALRAGAPDNVSCVTVSLEPGY